MDKISTLSRFLIDHKEEYTKYSDLINNLYFDDLLKIAQKQIQLFDNHEVEEKESFYDEDFSFENSMHNFRLTSDRASILDELLKKMKEAYKDRSLDSLVSQLVDDFVTSNNWDEQLIKYLEIFPELKTQKNFKQEVLPFDDSLNVKPFGFNSSLLNSEESEEVEEIFNILKSNSDFNFIINIYHRNNLIQKLTNFLSNFFNENNLIKSENNKDKYIKEIIFKVIDEKYNSIYLNKELENIESEIQKKWNILVDLDQKINIFKKDFIVSEVSPRPQSSINTFKDSISASIEYLIFICKKVLLKNIHQKALSLPKKYFFSHIDLNHIRHQLESKTIHFNPVEDASSKLFLLNNMIDLYEASFENFNQYKRVAKKIEKELPIECSKMIESINSSDKKTIKWIEKYRIDILRNIYSRQIIRFASTIEEEIQKFNEKEPVEGLDYVSSVNNNIFDILYRKKTYKDMIKELAGEIYAQPLLINNDVKNIFVNKIITDIKLKAAKSFEENYFKLNTKPNKDGLIKFINNFKGHPNILSFLNIINKNNSNYYIKFLEKITNKKIYEKFYAPELNELVLKFIQKSKVKSEEELLELANNELFDHFYNLLQKIIAEDILSAASVPDRDKLDLLGGAFRSTLNYLDVALDTFSSMSGLSDNATQELSRETTQDHIKYIYQDYIRVIYGKLDNISEKFPSTVDSIPAIDLENIIIPGSKINIYDKEKKSLPYTFTVLDNPNDRIIKIQNNAGEIRDIEYNQIDFDIISPDIGDLIFQINRLILKDPVLYIDNEKEIISNLLKSLPIKASDISKINPTQYEKIRKILYCKESFFISEKNIANKIKDSLIAVENKLIDTIFSSRSAIVAKAFGGIGYRDISRGIDEVFSRNNISNINKKEFVSKILKYIEDSLNLDSNFENEKLSSFINHIRPGYIFDDCLAPIISYYNIKNYDTILEVSYIFTKNYNYQNSNKEDIIKAIKILKLDNLKDIYLLKKLFKAASFIHNNSSLSVSHLGAIIRSENFNSDSKISIEYIESCLSLFRLGGMKTISDKNSSIYKTIEHLSINNVISNIDTFILSLSKFSKICMKKEGIRSNLGNPVSERKLDLWLTKVSDNNLDTSAVSTTWEYDDFESRVEKLSVYVCNMMSIDKESNSSNYIGKIYDLISSGEFKKIMNDIKNSSSTKEEYKKDIILKSIIQNANSNLKILEESENIIKYSKISKEKDKRLFNFEYEDSGRKFRFRVLRDYDPYHFTVGADTNCCQRIGGLGENAAIDSFVNPLAGVLILEALTGGSWNLISQSYFHYIPEQNGLILDNVERNYSNLSSFFSDKNYDINDLYATFAIYIKNKYNLGYVRCGTDHNKLKNDLFKKESFKNDPRYFHYKKYTDFKASNHIDLCRPNFEPNISLN